MSIYTIPAADAAPEEWGRLAVSIPGWRWMPQIRDGATGNVYMGHCWCDGWHAWEADDDMDGAWPDPDDPATEGCLFALLGDERDSIMVLPNTKGLVEWHNGADFDLQSLPLGRAAIAAAAAICRRPGGEG